MKPTALGEFLRVRRLSENKRQVQSAKEIGVGSSVYCRWEKGQTLPSEESLVKISTGLNVPLADLRELCRGEWDEADMSEVPINLLPLIRLLARTKLRMITQGDFQLVISMQKKLPDPSEPLSLKIIEALILRHQRSTPSSL